MIWIVYLNGTAKISATTWFIMGGNNGSHWMTVARCVFALRPAKGIDTIIITCATMNEN